MRVRLPFALVAVVLTGCSGDFETVGAAPPLSPVGSAIAESKAAEALENVDTFSPSNQSWIGGNADFFRDARARTEGDLITVRIAINDRASLNNSSNRSRSANAGADLGFTYDLMGVVGADVNGKGGVNSNSRAAGEGATARSERIDLSVAAVVTKVLPNGYLVIEGSQEVLVNFEQRVLTLGGIIRPSDIAPDNSISYEKIAEARIAYGGRGRISEVQQPGWAQQIWDRVAPY